MRKKTPFYAPARETGVLKENARARSRLKHPPFLKIHYARPARRGLPAQSHYVTAWA
jgi:hypothetical protein